MIALVLASLLVGVGWSAEPDSCANKDASVSACPEHYFSEPKSLSVVGTDRRDRINMRIEAALALRQEYLDLADQITKSKDPEIFAELERRKQAKRVEMRQAFAAALEQTIQAYDLMPPQISFTYDERLLPAARKYDDWNPTFSEQEKPDGRHWRARTEGELKAERLKNSVVRDNGQRVEGGAMAAGTLSDDRIQMYWTAFVRTETRTDGTVEYFPDADHLAGLVAHETVHWVYNVAKHGQVDTVAKYFEEDAQAYKQQAAALAGRPELKKEAEDFAQACREQAAVAHAEHLTKDQAIIRYSGKWIGIETLQNRIRMQANARALPPREKDSGPGNPEPVKQSADQDFFDSVGRARGITQDAIDTFEEHERARRAEEIRQDQARKRIVREQEERRRQEALAQARLDSARACGFEEYTSRFNPDLNIGFSDHSQGFSYPAGAAPTSEERMAEFALARACLNAISSPSGDIGQVCGSGFEMLTGHWEDATFRYNLYSNRASGRERGKLDLGEPDSVYWCIHDVINKTAAPFSLEAFRQSVRQFKKEAVEYRKKVLEAERKWKRQQPDPEPTQSNGGGEGGGGEGSGSRQNFCESKGCTWLGGNRCACPVN